MKKLKVYFISVLAACGLFYSASAIPPMPPGPVDPTIDPADDATYYLNVATNFVNNATTQMSVVTQTMNLQATSLLNKYVGKFQGFMGGMFKKKQELPATKKIEESTVADIYNPIDVQKAMYTMFFEYPAVCDDRSDQQNAQDCKDYDKMREEFYQDTIIEIYTAVRELEKKFPEIEDSIASLETALAEGKNGAEKPENGNNAIIKNLYNTYDTLNTILKVIEEIEAMKIQYFATQAIGSNTVRPRTPEKAEQDALNEWFMPTQAKIARAKVNVKETLQFADQADTKKKLKYSSMTFAETPDMGTQAPFSGSAEDVALMEKIGAAQKGLKETIQVHNQIQLLDALRAAYDNYNKQKRLHEKSIEALKKTEKCAINYYATMYENPQKVWNGGLPESMVTNHEQRKGISGWAFKAYSLAKAGDSGVMDDMLENVEADDFSDVQVDTGSVDVRDLSSNENLSSTINKETASGFKDAQKERSLTAMMSESERVPWNIASEMGHMLAEDQFKNGKNGKWGTAKKLYPVWRDTKSYYDQYLDGKYEGIIKRLDLFNTNKLALEIAEKINNMSDDENKAQNATIIRRIKSALDEDQQISSADLDALVAEKKQKLDQLYQTKESQLSAINQQKNKVLQELTSVQEELNRLASQLQTALEDKKKAETTISAMESLINTLYKYEIDKEALEYIEMEKHEYQKERNGNIIEQSSLYHGIYQNMEKLGYAQLWKQEIKQEDDLFKKEEPREVETYTEQVIKVKEIEEEEPISLLVAQSTLAKNRKLSLELEQKIIEINEKIRKAEAQKASLKKVIDEDLSNKKDVIKEQYVLAANNVTQIYDAKLLDEENKYQTALRKFNNIDLVAYYKEKFNSLTYGYSGIGYSSSLIDILTDARSLVNDARGTAQEMVRNTRRKMADMGDALYETENHSKIVAMHKQLMENLKKLPEGELKNFGSKVNAYASYSGIINLLRSVYTTYIVEDACVNNYCYEPDKEYFVSVNGKRRDFLAPKSVYQNALASVRETIYFDVNDYDLIPKSKEGVVSPRDIIQNLSYIPDIWKKILTSPAYVEKDIDFAELLEPAEGKEDKPRRMLANSGLYPCLYENYVVTSEGDRYVIYSKTPTSFFGGIFGSSSIIEDDEKAYKKLLEKGYAQCQDMRIWGSGSYLTVKNLSEDVAGEARVKGYSTFPFDDDEETDNGKAKISDVSELSYLFKYDNGLKYNDLALQALHSLSESNKNMNGDMGQSLVLYDQLILSHSQIGEFLKAIDKEQSMAEAVLNMKVEIEEAKQNLQELFDKAGFVASSDFDISKDSDYNLARNKLLNYRNSQINRIASSLSSAQSSQNDIIRERLKKINNVLAAMRKDAQAYTTIGENSADNAELAQSIRTETANREVAAKQKQKADEAFENEINKTGKVFCYQLIDNM